MITTTDAPATAVAPEQGVCPDEGRPTIWGLTPTEVHDRFWAARGVQVVRPGEQTQTVQGAELFLLMAPRLLASFRLRNVVQQLSWIKPQVMWLRLTDERERGYRERVNLDDSGIFQSFGRDYGGSDTRLARVALTPHAHIAAQWRSATNVREGWRRLKATTQRSRRHTQRINARTYDRTSDVETMQFMRDLLQQWQRPDTVIERARRDKTAWRDREVALHRTVSFVGPAWIGAGRSLEPNTTVVGPAVLWDDPDHRPDVGAVAWEQLEPGQILRRAQHVAAATRRRRPFKRAMDIGLSLVGLGLSLPLYPLVMAAIYLEDGRPFFFTHRRETQGGREFGCLKFRSMRKDSEQIKRRLMAENQNQVDGPQFYVPDDPRITRVGRFIRKTHIDELPQFLNVLVGHMSMVGPRPSPRSENQYCPPWRDARLSVRPGVTGLWQVMRTRDKDTDFQEWIRYDIEYVQNNGFRLDLWIIWRTIRAIILRK